MGTALVWLKRRSREMRQRVRRGRATAEPPPAYAALDFFPAMRIRPEQFKTERWVSHVILAYCEMLDRFGYLKFRNFVKLWHEADAAMDDAIRAGVPPAEAADLLSAAIEQVEPIHRRRRHSRPITAQRSVSLN